MAQHPAYKDSTLVQTSAMASRLIVTGSNYIANALISGADAFTKKTKPNPKPVTFSPATQTRLRKINTFSQTAADLSAKTVGQVGKYAQNFGASLARRKENGREKGFDKDGKPINYKPGILNKSLIALSTLTDGIEQGARNVLSSGAAAATAIVGHRYGPDAGAAAADIAGGVKNVALVYIDASGVSRKAILKSVAKGMVIGRLRDGKQVVVGGGDGGQVSLAAPGGTSPGSDPRARSRSPAAFGAREPAARRPSPVPTPPPAYGAAGTSSLSGTPVSSGKR